MNKIKACIFDLDGTIVDSMFLFGINIVNTLQSYGVTPPEDIVRIVTPIGYNNCIDYCIDQFKLKTTHEEMLGKMDAFALPYYRDTILAKEYTKDFFEKLKSQNIKICLLTASPRRFFEPCLERVGLLISALVKIIRKYTAEQQKRLVLSLRKLCFLTITKYLLKLLNPPVCTLLASLTKHPLQMKK